MGLLKDNSNKIRKYGLCSNLSKSQNVKIDVHNPLTDYIIHKGSSMKDNGPDLYGNNVNDSSSL